MLVSLLAGCAAPAGRPNASQSNTLVVALPQEPVSLNPLLLEGPIAYAIGDLLYSYLTNYDSEGNMVPAVAVRVPTTQNGGVSADGKRVTFHLRHDVRWQDGVPLTARDVAFTYRAIMNPANDIPTRYGYDAVASVTVPDPYTVVVRLKRPLSPIVPFFFGGDSNYPIMPEHLLGRYSSINDAPFSVAPIGSGPYEFVKWQHGDRLILAANPRYYGGKPRLARMVLPFIHDPATTINELQTGEIGAAFSLDASRISALQGTPRHRIVVTPIPYFFAMAFNTSVPALRDPSVRRALAMAIDRDTIVRKVSHGLYDAHTGMRGVFTWAFDPQADTLRYDPAAAQKMLARAGWSPHGKRLQLDCRSPLDRKSPRNSQRKLQPRKARLEWTFRSSGIPAKCTWPTTDP